MAQISIQEQPNPMIALTALKWLLCAQRQLTAETFLAAVGVDPKGELIKLSIETLLDICCNLVIYDSFSRVFRLTHLSVREYLERNGHCATSPSNAVVLHRCLDVIFLRSEYDVSIDASAARALALPLPQLGSIKPISFDMHLFSYSNKCWWDHFNRITSIDIDLELGSKLKRFCLRDCRKDTSFARWILQDPIWYYWKLEDLERLFAIVDIAASEYEMKIAPSSPVTNGRLLQLVLHHKRQKYYGAPLLQLAVSVGDLALTRFLVELGAPLNTSNNEGKTPLHLAIQRKLFEITRCLLENGATINFARRDWLVGTTTSFASRNPSQSHLSLAAMTGDAKLVTELLKYGACEEDVRKSLFASPHCGSLESHRSSTVRGVFSYPQRF